MGKRRAAAWAIIVAAAVAAGFVRWPLSPVRVGQRLNDATDASAPLIWRTPEAATFSILPWPNLRIVNAQVDDALGANLMSAPEARLDLTLAGLADGRFAPARIFLVAPTISIDLDGPMFARREGPAEFPRAASALGLVNAVSLSNGVLRIASRTRGLDTLMESVQGRIDGLTAGDPLRVGLSAVWRGTPLTLAGALTDPVRAANGEPSAFNAALVSSVANFALNGVLVGGATPGVSGEVAASSHSLTALWRLIGLSPPSVLAADDVAISGAIRATAVDVTLDQATVTSAGQTLQGALRVAQINRRSVISGTLDAERLTVAPLFGYPPPLTAPDGSWSAKPFAFTLPLGFDVDLRISVARVDLYRRELAEAAASAILKDGVLAVSLLDAAAYGGRLKGEFRLACRERSLQIEARAKLEDADFGAALSDFSRGAPSGNGAAEFALRTAGDSPAEAIDNLRGSAALRLEQGVVAGVNLEEALRRSQRRPIDVARDMRLGGTTFDKLSLELALGKGVIHVLNGALDAHGVSANLQGEIDLPAQTWNLRVNAAQTGPSGEESTDAAHLSFDIDGPWSQPRVRAAAPAVTRPTVAVPSRDASP